IMSVKRTVPSTTGNFTWSATPANPVTIILQTLSGSTTVGNDVLGPPQNFDPSVFEYTWELAHWDGTFSGPTGTANQISNALDASTIFDLNTGPFQEPLAGHQFIWEIVF